VCAETRRAVHATVPHPLKVLPPSEMLLKVLSGVLITCLACSQKVRVSDLKTHTATKCGVGSTAEVMSITDILSKPLPAPPTTAEQEVASNVVRRMLSGHGETIRLPTAGRVINIEGTTITITMIMTMYTNSYSHLDLLMYQQPECPLHMPVAGRVSFSGGDRGEGSPPNIQASPLRF
jgi:hypothetical protein